MKTLAEWLDRGSSPKKPRKRIPKVTAKRAKANREYAKRRKAFLAAHPMCMAWTRITEHLASCGDPWALSQSCLPPIGPMGWATEIHHMRKPKRKYLNDESTWLAVSPWSHRWIEDNKSTARLLGLLF